MKKFLSMVMAAAMVVSLVPATAFAASGDVKATAKVVDAENYTVSATTSDRTIGADAELQLYVTTADYSQATATTKITLTLDNAETTLTDATASSFTAGSVIIKDDDGSQALKADGTFGAGVTGLDGTAVTLTEIDVNADKDEIEYTFSGQFKKGWTIAFAMDSTMTKATKGKTATVSVDSDDITITGGDDLTYAAIEAEGIKASVKDTVDVATEEVATLKDIKIEATVGDFGDFASAGDTLKLKLNSGFEFAVASGTQLVTNASSPKTESITTAMVDDDEIELTVTSNMIESGVDTWTIEGLQVEATSAKAGSTATVKVYLDGCDTVSVEVAKVVDYTVTMSVDEDDDVPVIYSGVDVDNTGITDDSDHQSLEVTIEESFAGAWNNSKDFTLSIPEGVYITNVVSPALEEADLNGPSSETVWFQEAYEEGDYVNLTFKRRTWDETVPGTNDPAKLTFTLELVADPNFEGDVVLTLTGDAVEEQEVTIAKFVKPFTVEAQQNDMQIDYRNTEIPTSVVIKEAEAGLWDKNTEFKLSLDKILFDDEGTVTVDDKSGLELKDDKVRVDSDDNIYFTVSSRSDDEPAVVTLSGMQLYMNRSLPAGAYDLEVYSNTMLYGDDNKAGGNDGGYLEQTILKPTAETTITEINDINEDFYSTTAKAGFVNIVTAGREDTESFTTKVVVPVGESYLISGENKVDIDVPAYINANGYTMLPLRAVAVALGINSNNVLWDQSTRTATIMYGSKIINMTLGQKVVYVNGAMIPATAAVEITNDRMFLGLRDLGNALGVTDITWDAATKTATLNGNK